LSRLQKSLRLKPSTEVRQLDLDVRKDKRTSPAVNCCTGWRCFRFLGESCNKAAARPSTFHEVWQMEWKPEFVVAVIEANLWGNTLESAAAAKVIHDAMRRPT